MDLPTPKPPSPQHPTLLLLEWLGAFAETKASEVSEGQKGSLALCCPSLLFHEKGEGKCLIFILEIILEMITE